MNNGWSRVKTASLKSKNKDSMWSSNETTEGFCEGIRVNYACGDSSTGFIYSIYIMVLSLSKDKLQNDEFVVIPIEGLSMNGHIDPRNEEVGLVCLIGANVAQNHFYWYNENVTYPTFQSIRKA